MESLIENEKLKIKTKQEWYLQWWNVGHGLNKIFLQKMPIYRATKNFRSLQILQPVSIIWKYLRDFEGPNPQGFKFTMLSLVLFGCIPFEY
jgi:hypothetical protein